MDLNNFLPYRLSVLSLRISKGIAAHYQQYDITISQWRVMVILNQYKKLNAKQAANYSQMDKVRISRTMKQLVSKRLITIKTDTNDARAKHYQLSSHGQEMVNHITPLASDFEQKLYQSLNDSEKKSLDMIIKKLNKVLD